MGVISVETRATETKLWADPAVESSQEETIKEAGQVWYPNSAFKTAQAIRDFNNGEQLPLIIFANWRGFSGGQSDMSKEVLKFGAMIVDALREFKQPIFIYILGELRGGAWVVVDPSINPEMMEMYCYEDARGGVLEPQGIVEIKYRTPRIISTMERLDSEYHSLKQSLISSRAHNATRPDQQLLAKLLKDRETELAPIYEQAAVELADLHDRPQRMVAKGVIKGSVTWVTARTFFYWKLSRRLSELKIIRALIGKSSLEFLKAQIIVQNWFFEDCTTSVSLTDKEFIDWVKSRDDLIDSRIKKYHSEQAREDMVSLAKSFPSAFMQSLPSIIASLSLEDQTRLFSHFNM